MAHTLIYIKDGLTRHPDFRFPAPVSFRLDEGEHTAIAGPIGSGKSLLVDMITGAHPLLGTGVSYDFSGSPSLRASDNIRHVTFRDAYGTTSPAYYQQRWNAADDQPFPTVRDVVIEAADREVRLARLAGGFAADEALSAAHADMVRVERAMQAVGIMRLADKRVNLLSSGELRRLQIAKVMVAAPRVLIIDNPYIGLDVEARAMLTALLGEIARKLTLVIVVSRPDDVPPFVDRVVTMDHCAMGPELSREEYLRTDAERTAQVTSSLIHLPEAPEAEKEDADGEADNLVADFRNVSVRYGERTILDGLSWQVRRGEHWALTGENGAGKSTLLSLVCADNPQAYACDIRLFGLRRGRGESIWDIKRRIGYVSPEIFTTYRKSLPTAAIVASGLHDTIGLYRRPSAADLDVCRRWLSAFGAAHLADRDYLTLSSGEQRLVLLVRAFVKQPELLILDEPFHGLDNATRERARRIIAHYMDSPRRTLIMVTHYEEELPSCIDHRLRLVRH